MVEMIGPAFEACGKVQYFPPGAHEVTPFGSLTQLCGDLPVMLGSRGAHSRQNASAHKMTSDAVETMMPSAPFAR